MHTRIKICGITRESDARLATQLGADAIGFVLVPRSRRNVSVEQAGVLSRCLGPYVTRTVLFLDPEPALVSAAISEIPDLVPQFHGTESAEFCDSFNRPYIKAFGLGDGMPAPSLLGRYQNVQAFLFDSNRPGQLGGTGHAFDWQILANYREKPVVLAGGLGPDNVAEAIRQVRPVAVDVSTGVEESPGIKDPALMTHFVEQVRQEQQG